MTNFYQFLGLKRISRRYIPTLILVNLLTSIIVKGQIVHFHETFANCRWINCLISRNFRQSAYHSLNFGLTLVAFSVMQLKTVPQVFNLYKKLSKFFVKHVCFLMSSSGIWAVQYSMWSSSSMMASLNSIRFCLQINTFFHMMISTQKRNGKKCSIRRMGWK